MKLFGVAERPLAECVVFGSAEWILFDAAELNLVNKLQLFLQSASFEPKYQIDGKENVKRSNLRNTLIVLERRTSLKEVAIPLDAEKIKLSFS